MIINVDDYLNEAKCQLNNTEFYQKLNQDLTETHAVNETIRKFAKEKLLKEHVAKALTIYDPKTARFYLLAKSTQEKKSQHDPLTSAIGIPTSTIAEFVDLQLQTHCGEVKIIPERYN